MKVMRGVLFTVGDVQAAKKSKAARAEVRALFEVTELTDTDEDHQLLLHQSSGLFYQPSSHPIKIVCK